MAFALVGVDGGEVYVYYGSPGYDHPDTIAGGAIRGFPIDRRATKPMTCTVERGGDCDAQRDRPTLLVSFAGEKPC